jgi:hypothetical protein
MMAHPREAAGAGIDCPKLEPVEQTSSNCDAGHGAAQLSVPPMTPPSTKTVAPLLTWQTLAAGSGRQPVFEASTNVSAFGG